MDENERAKRNIIDGFFKGAEARLALLSKLNEYGHKQEVMTLCLTYIDSFAQWLCWPSDKTGKNFVEALIAYGGDPLLGLIHPLQVIQSFRRMKPSWQQIAVQIQTVYAGPAYILQSGEDFLKSLKGHISKNEIDQIHLELWRGTTASIAYFELRNPSVHKFVASSEISFSQTAYQEKSVPGIDFLRLYTALKNLVAEARRRSEANSQWFGNDAILESI